MFILSYRELSLSLCCVYVIFLSLLGNLKESQFKKKKTSDDRSVHYQIMAAGPFVGCRFDGTLFEFTITTLLLLLLRLLLPSVGSLTVVGVNWSVRFVRCVIVSGWEFVRTTDRLCNWCVVSSFSSSSVDDGDCDCDDDIVDDSDDIDATCRSASSSSVIAKFVVATAVDWTDDVTAPCVIGGDGVGIVVVVVVVLETAVVVVNRTQAGWPIAAWPMSIPTIPLASWTTDS